MPNEADFQELEKRVADLTQRIFRLEQQLASGHFVPGVAPPKPPKVEAPAAPPPIAVMPAKPSPLPVSLQQQLKPPAPRRDLESLIGSQWLNRIGILAMMIGVAYFLKLAFDNNWIGPRDGSPSGSSPASALSLGAARSISAAISIFRIHLRRWASASCTCRSGLRSNSINSFPRRLLSLR